MSTPTVVGLDLSLTSTGVCNAGADGVTTSRVGSNGKAKASLVMRRARLRTLADSIIVKALAADLVLVEQPAYAQTAGHQHDRSGLWWIVVDRLHECEIPTVEVSPTTLKRYVLGKGGGKETGKDFVLAAVVRRYLDVCQVADNNEADALALAAMGRRRLGAPIDDLPKTHVAAMDAVNWGEVG